MATCRSKMSSSPTTTARPATPGDDFHPTAVLVGGFNSGDTNQDNILDTDETWHYTATGPAIVGEYANVATVSGSL